MTISTRRALRDDAKTRILAAVTAAGTRVFKSHNLPMSAVDLPSVLIYTPAERHVHAGQTEPTFATSLTLKIDCVVFGVDNEATADAADDLADEVEAVIIGAHEWRQQFGKIAVYDISAGPGKDGEQLFFMVRMALDVEVSTQFTTTVTDDFDEAEIEVDLHPADGVAEATILVVLPD